MTLIKNTANFALRVGYVILLPDETATPEACHVAVVDGKFSSENLEGMRKEGFLTIQTSDEAMNNPQPPKSKKGL